LPPPPDDPTRANLCPDNDGDEELDLGPTPPYYHKEDVVAWGPLYPSSSTDWTFVSQTFNSGANSVLYVYFWQTFDPGNYADLDDMRVTPTTTTGPCGDGTCDSSEDCSSCPEDCGQCQSSPCGDGTCDADEDCSSCPDDCGACADVHGGALRPRHR
jgi:hypothetical protein